MLSFKMNVRAEMWNFWKTDKVLSFLVYLNQKWQKCHIYRIYIKYIWQNGHSSQMKLPNFNKIFSRICLITMLPIWHTLHALYIAQKRYFSAFLWSKMAFWAKIGKIGLKTGKIWTVDGISWVIHICKSYLRWS